jgi:hypothetical protein
VDALPHRRGLHAERLRDVGRGQFLEVAEHERDAIVRLDSLRGRCHMTTVDPDTLEVNPGVLRDIVGRFGNQLALNAGVVRAGTIRVGDPVRLVRERRPAPATMPRCRH